MGNIKKKKIFAWLHLLTPHLPYLPPAKYARKVKGNYIRQKEALYNGEIQAEDEVIGLVLASIKKHVGYRNALIIFLSDHGEEFGEHGSMEHGHSLHSEVTKVPLIFTGPGISSGQIITQNVGTIDVLPTILEFVGIDIKKKEGERNGFEGKSLFPLLLKKQLNLKSHSVYSEGMLYGGIKRSFISGNYRIIYDKQVEKWRLYNIKVDPGETEDLSKNEPRIAAIIRKKLNKHYYRILEDFKQLSKKYKKPKSKADHNRTIKVLKSLGYIN